MSFLDEITKVQEQITLDSFITEVSKYGALDEALIELPSIFMEFYINNQVSADKLIMNFNINPGQDSGIYDTLQEAEEQGTPAWTPSGNETTKVIRYKGEIIVLRHTSETGVWESIVGFRNLVKGLRYSKTMIDNYK